MKNLQPTLWRTCRTLANKTRLKLLWKLCEAESYCVCDLAQIAHISESNASIQLRALNARGLITPCRKGLKVFYEPKPNPKVRYAEELLAVLQQCRKEGIPFDEIMASATAFTHERRLRIIRVLNAADRTFQQLSEETHISPASLVRHLAKLRRRGLVVRDKKSYRLVRSKHIFCRALLTLACL